MKIKKSVTAGYITNNIECLYQYELFVVRIFICFYSVRELSMHNSSHISLYLCFAFVILFFLMIFRFHFLKEQKK